MSAVGNCISNCILNRLCCRVIQRNSNAWDCCLNKYLSFIAELEAIEACKWLRAAGFPQYAQMYEGEYLQLRKFSYSSLHVDSST